MIFETFLSTPQIADIFAPSSVVQAMLEFEAALVRAQAAEGLVPAAAAQAIAGVCKAELFDVAAIAQASGRAGSLAIPLVQRLTETVALFDSEAAGYVHWGSTSQDVIDTAMALLLRRALAVIDDDLGRLINALLAQARAHETAPMLARTLMQPAQVVSWGFKLVAWVAPLVRSREQLHRLGHQALALQLGGAVGTRAMLGERGDAMARHMAQALQLRLPDNAWHTQRDDWIRLHAELGVLCGSLGKLAKDLSLLGQAEVGEVVEGAGGGSSAMPHKRNPVASMVALSASLRAPHRVAALMAAMVQEHERGLGNWQAELAESAGLCLSVHGAVAALAGAAGALQVDPARMVHNIDALKGLVHAEAAAMALAPVLGKAGAHALLSRLSGEVAAGRGTLAELFLAHLMHDTALRSALGTHLGEAWAPTRLADTVATLFSAQHAARPAIASARPRLAALQADADRLSAAAPWPHWLA